MTDLAHINSPGAFPIKNIIRIGNKRIIVIDDGIVSKLCLTDDTVIEQNITDAGILMKIRKKGNSLPTVVVGDSKH